MIDEVRKLELIKTAQAASRNAYSPYSGFKVGAAILTANGKIYSGCNVENASYSMTICAERNAVFQAVAEGEKAIIAVAVYADSELAFPPCGACRQVLAEFAEDMAIFVANRNEVKETSLAELLPDKFTLIHD
jgi:cytidine deaminase